MTTPTPQLKTHTLTTPSTHPYTYTYLHVPPSTPTHPTLLLLHGFPLPATSWLPLIAHLTPHGYGILAPNLLGYAPSSTPPSVSAYSSTSIAAHVAELLAHEGIVKVVGVGHDWGSVLLARMWEAYPRLFSALTFMSVPYQRPTAMDLDAMNGMTKQAFGYEAGGYWYLMLAEGAAGLLAEKTHSFLTLILTSSPTLMKTSFCPRNALKTWLEADRRAPLPEWLSQAQLDEWAAQLREGGFEGPLNWYHAALQPPPPATDLPPLTVPTVFLTGAEDPVGRPEFSQHAAMQGQQQGYLRNDVKVEVLPGAGHWLGLEKAEEVAKVLVEMVEGMSK